MKLQGGLVLLGAIGRFFKVDDVIQGTKQLTREQRACCASFLADEPLPKACLDEDGGCPFFSPLGKGGEANGGEAKEEQGRGFPKFAGAITPEGTASAVFFVVTALLALPYAALGTLNHPRNLSRIAKESIGLAVIILLRNILFTCGGGGFIDFLDAFILMVIATARPRLPSIRNLPRWMTAVIIPIAVIIAFGLTTFGMSLNWIKRVAPYIVGALIPRVLRELGIPEGTSASDTSRQDGDLLKKAATAIVEGAASIAACMPMVLQAVKDTSQKILKSKSFRVIRQCVVHKLGEIGLVCLIRFLLGAHSHSSTWLREHIYFSCSWEVPLATLILLLGTAELPNAPKLPRHHVYTLVESVYANVVVPVVLFSIGLLSIGDSWHCLQIASVPIAILVGVRAQGLPHTAEYVDQLLFGFNCGEVDGIGSPWVSPASFFVKLMCVRAWVLRKLQQP